MAMEVAIAQRSGSRAQTEATNPKAASWAFDGGGKQALLIIPSPPNLAINRAD